MQKILSILLTSYKNYIAYIPDIIGTNIVLVLRIIVTTVLYTYLYENFGVNGEISGYTLVEMTFAVIITQIIVTSAPRISEEVQLDVKSGKISSFLLNPISYVNFKFLEFFPTFIHNTTIGLIIGLPLGFLLLGEFPVTLGGIFGGLILLILSMLTYFFGYMSIGLLAFYTEDVEAFTLIYGKAKMILGGNLIPIPFLPQFLQTIAYISPFAYFGYTTGLVFAKFEMNIFLIYLLIQFVWLVINYFACITLYHFAKNKLTINGG